MKVAIKSFNMYGSSTRIHKTVESIKDAIAYAKRLRWADCEETKPSKVTYNLSEGRPSCLVWCAVEEDLHGEECNTVIWERFIELPKRD